MRSVRFSPSAFDPDAPDPRVVFIRMTTSVATLGRRDLHASEGRREGVTRERSLLDRERELPRLRELDRIGQIQSLRLRDRRNNQPTF